MHSKSAIVRCMIVPAMQVWSVGGDGDTNNRNGERDRRHRMTGFINRCALAQVHRLAVCFEVGETDEAMSVSPTVSRAFHSWANRLNARCTARTGDANPKASSGQTTDLGLSCGEQRRCGGGRPAVLGRLFVSVRNLD